MNTPIDGSLEPWVPVQVDPKLTGKLELATQMLEAIQDCFTECQGMQQFSVEESDRYIELADLLMRLEANRRGVEVERKS